MTDINEKRDKSADNNKITGSGIVKYLLLSRDGDWRLNKARFITQAALFAAAYATLTILLAPISFGQQQLRVAEALSIFPAFTPAAIPGLFIGCLIANTVSFYGLPDLIFGSAATLISAQLTYMISKAVKDRSVLTQVLLIPLPAVVINTVVIGVMISVLASVPFPVAAFGVAAGQTLSCYGLGAPLYLLLRGYALRKASR
jgi:uncharacterized membrane protein